MDTGLNSFGVDVRLIPKIFGPAFHLEFQDCRTLPEKTKYLRGVLLNSFTRIPAEMIIFPGIHNNLPVSLFNCNDGANAEVRIVVTELYDEIWNNDAAVL